MKISSRWLPKHLVLLTLILFFPAFSFAAEITGKIVLPKYKTVKMDNGMTLLLLERHQLPLVSFRWTLKSGGSIGDPEGCEGLALLTAQLVRKGTQSRTADQISEALDFVGANFHSRATQEYSWGSAEFLKKDLNLAVDLLSDMLLHPSFPPDEVDKMIKQEIDGIKEDKAVPEQVIQYYFDGLLFGPQGYGRPVGGTETTLAKITRDQIVSFYQAHFVPNEFILAVAGDFSTSELEAALKVKFGSLKSSVIAPLNVKEASSVQGRHVLVVDKPDSTQTFFRLGNVGIARTSPDWIPVHVVNTLFGGRFTSMINTALRIQSGLTYGANSFFNSRRARGSFVIASYTPNESTERALDMTLDVLKSFHEKGISQDQLQSAKNYIKGQFGPTIETNDQLANLMAELEFYGLGPQYINSYFDKVDALTLADAKRIIETYYPLNNLDFVLIGKGSVIEPVARKLAGDVKKKSITDPGF
ncbi:MAG: M16 family metallopeptidase [Terriglobia bacterium]